MKANYAHRFLNFGVFGVSVEVPFVVDPTNKLQYNMNVVPMPSSRTSSRRQRG